MFYGASVHPGLVTVAALALTPIALVVMMAVLTTIGSRRRGAAPVLAVLSGLFFPVTWVAWYVWDEQPRRLLRSSGAAPS